MGEWPWFYNADSGAVLDHYQVYSVHQDGMAPAYLLLADSLGYDDARRQIELGYHWIHGKNELGVSMLDHDHGLVLRSQMRREAGERHRRALRSIVNRTLGRAGRYVGSGGLQVNRECRSYHLGWILHAFGSREDYPEITHHPDFGQGQNGDTSEV
jgi:hypothetical protein